MAEATVKEENIQECPICTEEYRDARVLECGHHFCRVCLEEIATGHPDGHVTCPTCRHVTKTAGQDDISSLPKYRIVNDFVGLVKSALVKKEEGSFQCQICPAESPQKSVKVCFGCQTLLCPQCTSIHSQIFLDSHHLVYDITEEVVCQKHPKSSQHLKTVFCKTCKELCCLQEAASSHQDHKVEPTEIEGKRVKSEIREKIDIIKKSSSDEVVYDRVKTLLEEAREAKIKFADSVKNTRSALSDLQNKLTLIEEETKEKLDSEIKHLEMMAADLGDFKDAKQKLLSKMDHLEKHSSDQNTIKSFAYLPNYEPKFYRKLLSKHEIQLPELANIIDQLKDCQESLSIAQKNFLVDQSPLLLPLRKQTKFDVGSPLHCMVLDSKNKRLVFRRQNADAPLSVYDYDGNHVANLGKGIPGITDVGYQRFCLDAKRDLYIIPVKGDLVCMNLDGTVEKTIKSGLGYIHSVCHTGQDLYVCSSVKYCEKDGTGHLYSYDPSKEEKTPEFQTLRKNLKGHWNVICGASTSFCQDGDPVLIISEQWENELKVIDYRGLVKLSLSADIANISPSKLDDPYGLCIEPERGILLCDLGNSRILHIKVESDKPVCRVIMTDQQLASHVQCDVTERIVFLASMGGTVQILKE